MLCYAVSLLALGLPPGGQGDGFELPPGFTLERACAEQDSYLCLALDPQEQLLLGTEERGVLRARDGDGDGQFESVEALLPELTALMDELDSEPFERALPELQRIRSVLDAARD